MIKQHLFTLLATLYFAQTGIAQSSSAFTDLRDGQTYKTITFKNALTDNHAYLPIQKEAILKKIPYVDIELTALDQKTTMATIVVPVEDSSEAKAISQSVKRAVGKDGSLTLSFSAKGQNHEYEYENTAMGLVLAKK